MLYLKLLVILLGLVVFEASRSMCTSRYEWPDTGSRRMESSRAALCFGGSSPYGFYSRAVTFVHMSIRCFTFCRSGCSNTYGTESTRSLLPTHTHTCLPVSEWLANKRKGYWKIEGAIMSQIFSSVSISGWPGVDRAWSGLERLSATVTYILHCGSVLKGSFEAKNLMLRKAFVTRTLGGNKILPQTNRSCAPEWIKFNRDRSKAASLNPMKYVCSFGLMATHLSE